MISPIQATILGIIEGLTEFLPISSTGHLILASKLMGLGGESIKAFEMIIQGGALLAVWGLYRNRVREMVRGLTGRSAEGRGLLLNLLISFLPIAIAGFLLHQRIKENLFTTGAVAAALFLGGILMIAVDRFLGTVSKNGDSPKKSGTVPIFASLFQMTKRQAFLIGLAQVLALWPGTSRAMVTIVAALLLGFPATAAAEYSFLLALPSLGGAVLFDLFKSGPLLLRGTGLFSFLIGFFTAAGVAAFAIRAFFRYLAKHGLGLFGWYRIALAFLVWRMAS